MPKQDVEQKAREIAEPILAGEGLELVDVEFVREQGWILRPPPLEDSIQIAREGSADGLAFRGPVRRLVIERRQQRQ